MHNQQFDNAFKDKLGSFSPTPSSQSWNAIQAEVTSLPSSFSISKIIGVATFSIILISSLYFVLQKEENGILKTDLEQIVQTTKNIENNTPPTFESKTLDFTEKKQPPETSPKVRKQTTDTPVETNTPEITEVDNEEIVVVINKKTKTTNNVPTNTKEVEAIDKIYSKGEYVTFRFDFENTTGKNLNSVEIWEEFPEWCDVNTIKTVSSDNFHSVKTKVHKQYNEVVWKVKGDFSGDISSLNNRGFIEYRVKLMEDRKASELNKNQPQIK